MWANLKTFVSCASAALLLSISNSFAQETSSSPWAVSGGASLSTSYLWAGYCYGGMNLTPQFDLEYSLSDSWSLYAEAMAYVDTRINLIHSDSQYNCGVAVVGAAYKDFSFYLDWELTDYAFSNPGMHYLGAGFDWTVSEEFPLSISWYSILYNSAPLEDDGEVTSDGGQCHSTLISASYPVLQKDSFSLCAESALVPWLSPFCGYEKFSLCQLGVGGEWIIGESDIPLNFHLGWNPAAGIPYGAVSVGYFF